MFALILTGAPTEAQQGAGSTFGFSNPGLKWRNGEEVENKLVAGRLTRHRRGCDPFTPFEDFFEVLEALQAEAIETPRA